jgi:hypothetical protein
MGCTTRQEIFQFWGEERLLGYFVIQFWGEERLLGCLVTQFLERRGVLVQD